MLGDFQTASKAKPYRIGYSDFLDGVQECAAGMTNEDLAQYRAGVEDARRSGHLCELRMKPLKGTSHD